MWTSGAEQIEISTRPQPLLNTVYRDESAVCTKYIITLKNWICMQFYWGSSTYYFFSGEQTLSFYSKSEELLLLLLHVLLSGQADCRSRAESLISREENITKSWRADKDTCRRWHFIPVICLHQSFSRTCDERCQNVASFCDYLKYLSILFCRTCKADFTSDRVDFENMQPAGL